MMDFSKISRRAGDILITSVVWAYFTFGFLLSFSLSYFFASLFPKDGESAFQRLNHIFMKGFFAIIEKITPGLTIRIPGEVRSIRSSVIVCNHLSYLDPILLVSLFEKQKTIIKHTFFRMPIFKWVSNGAGYLPSESRESDRNIMIERVENMGRFLQSGGNLFIFPEGTRSHDGTIGRFEKGAFRIARRCGAPIKVLLIKNTNVLFTPGNFFFNTSVPNMIEIELIGTIDSISENGPVPVSELKEKVRKTYAISVPQS